MDSLLALTVANLRSFVRDRAALFWTIAFPVIFVVLFGTLFGGGGSADFQVGWVDQDGTPTSAQLMDAFAHTGLLTLKVTDQAAGLASARDGTYDAVIVVPKGYATAVGAPRGSAGTPADALALVLYVDPSHTGSRPG